MAATSAITIKNNAASDVTFTPSIQVKDGYEYRDTSHNITLAAPRTMLVTHRMVGPASASNDLHILRFTQVRLNETSQVRTAYIEVKISVPKDGPTATDVSDEGAFVRNFLTDANLTKILQGQY